MKLNFAHLYLKIHCVKKRKYYTTLTRTFLVIAVFISIIMVFSVLVLTNSINKSRNNALTSIIDSQINQASNTMRFINHSVNALYTSNEVNHWMETEVFSPDYYFTAVKLFDEIRHLSPFSDYLNYDIAITKGDSPFLVVTTNGTFSKPEFLREKEIQDFMDGIYKQKGKDNIVLLISRQIDSSVLKLIITIPLEVIVPQNIYTQMAIVAEDGSIPYASNDGIYNILKDPSNMYSLRKDIIDEVSFPLFGFKIVYGFKDYSNVYMLTMFLIISPVLLLFLVFVLTKRARVLYEPVDKALQTLNIPQEDEIDELQVIIDNCKQIAKLSDELNIALKSRQMLFEQQKYRSFLRGIPTGMKEDDSTAFFALAIAIYHPEAENVNAVFSNMEMKATEKPHVHSIRFSIYECVFICKNPQKEEADRILHETINDINQLKGDNIVRFAFVAAKQGYASISSSYKKAQEIMEYRYKVKNRIILTEEDISTKKTLMYYPITEERKLINAALASKEEAINIFDNLVEINENRGLATSEFQRFGYNIVGTVLRIFQELKETPEDLIGKEIIWRELFHHKNSQEMLSELRNILLRIISARKQRDLAEEALVVNRMKEYISTHYMENIMLIDLSTEFNLTPKYCSSIFAKLSNDTFKNYLNEFRIKVACRKIEENPDIKISDLSAEVGFSSSNTFIRVFSKYTGITPKAYADNEIKKRYL